jgi:putative hydrolase of the HAD superfamily
MPEVKDTVLFDLGNTLVGYYGRGEVPAILRAAIEAGRDYLARQGLLNVEEEVIWQRVRQENREADDHRVCPLAERLARIFALAGSPPSGDLMEALCRRFMGPLFARARLYDDTVPTLREMRSRGLKTAIVSNTPWGSSPGLWREELDRLGLNDLVDAAVFCGDAGWRKPARPVFDLVLARLGSRPEQCLFVGDSYRWDVEGARAIGMDAVLIVRDGPEPESDVPVIRRLAELWPILGLRT